MRTIKFRVWDCDNESFSKIDFSDLERTIEELDSFRSYFSGSYFVGENYLQQFTGLQDKNGKDIYEGDIVKGETRVFTVKFEDGMFTTNVGKYLLNGNYEIIGSIHTTPELLNN